MTIMDFTVEETNLIAIYREQEKTATISLIAEAYPHMEEEMQEIADSVDRKLAGMNSDEYAGYAFSPADDDDGI